MTREEIVLKLFELKDEKYKKFLQKIVPTAKNLIGVRSPLLRKFAKQIQKESTQIVWGQTKEEYYEELLLQALLVPKFDEKNPEIFYNYVKNFVKKINSWAVCDVFCGSLKIPKTHLKEFYNFLLPYFHSTKEYHLRFAVVCLTDHYIDLEYLEDALNLLDKINHPGYYVKMAVSWAISYYYIAFPQKTHSYLLNCNLDDFTFSKTLSKITDSYRVSDQLKDEIRQLRKTHKKAAQNAKS